MRTRFWLALLFAIGLATPVTAQQTTRTVYVGGLDSAGGTFRNAEVGDGNTGGSTQWVLWQLPCLASGSGCLAAGTTTNPWNVIIRDGLGNAITSRAAGASRPFEFVQLDASGNIVTPSAGTGTSSNFGSAFPASGTAGGFNDGTNMQGARVYDTNTSGSFEYTIGAVLRSSGASGSVELGTPTNPIAFRPSDGSAFITPAVDYTHNVALTPATTAGPAVVGRASAAAPTDVGADDRAVLPWYLRNGQQVSQPAYAGNLAATGNGTSSSAVPRVSIASDSTGPAYNGATGSAVPARAAYIAGNGTGNLTGLTICDQSTPINVSTSGSTQLVALTSSQRVRVCAFSMMAGGTAAVKFVSGTGANCATGPSDLTGAYPLTTQTGAAPGNGIGQLFASVSSEALCINLSASVSVQGLLTYTKY